jgi:hypothetical protein
LEQSENIISRKIREKEGNIARKDRKRKKERIKSKANSK